MNDTTPDIWEVGTSTAVNSTSLLAGRPKEEYGIRKITPDDVLNFIGFGWFQWIAWLLVGLTYFGYGTDVSVFVFAGIGIQREWNLTNIEYAVFPAITLIPNIIGGCVFSVLADNYGRVWPYAISVAIAGVFGMATAFSPNYPVLLVLRIVVGLGIGGIRVLSYPTLIEFLPVKNRGKASVTTNFMLSLGLCAASGVAWWIIPTYSYNMGWRYFVFLVALPSLPVVLYRLVFYFQSPRFLIAKGQHCKAWKVFSVMARFNGKDLKEFVTEEEFYRAMVADIGRRPLSKAPSIKELFTILNPPYLRRTITLIVLLVTEEMGYLGAATFMPQFLTKLQGVNIYFTLFVSTLAQIPGTALMAIIMEWPLVGRLNSLRLFSALTIVFFLLIAFVQTAVTIPVFLVILFFLMPQNLVLIYVYISESYPTRIRSLSIAFLYTIQGIFGIAFPFVAGYSAGFRQPWLYPVVWAGVFSVQLVAGLVLNYETYGRNLVDITETM